MQEKPRKPGRPQGRTAAPQRKPMLGKPGERPQRGGRTADKPGRGPAAPRKVAGVDVRMLERLEQEGLLTQEGRRLREQANPARPGRPGAAAKRTPTDRRPKVRGMAPKLNAVESLVAERLHKVMAKAGVASRRHSEELIQAGRVTVNGQVVTTLGIKVVPGKDLIEVDGRPLGRPETLIYLLLNKPKGYVTTLYDPQGRPKVVDLLNDDVAQRVYPVGRLDYDTEGLLLLTNDGDLANGLMHPGRQVKKTYIAKLRGVPGPAKIHALEQGVELDDGPTAPAEVKIIEAKGPNSSTISIRIHEGRNRQVRRMCEAVGHEVIHLKRTTLGPLHLKDLTVGQWRELNAREVASLYTAAGLRAPRFLTAKAAELAAPTEPGAPRPAGDRPAAPRPRAEQGRRGRRRKG